MRSNDTSVHGVIVLEPEVFGDERGFFMESWNARVFASLGVDVQFVQDNHSKSRRWTLRGLHYQLRYPQGKLMRVTQGEVFDVTVDMRLRSPTFGRWHGELLSAANKRMLWAPAGIAHGFLVLSDTADVLYKCTDYYAPEHERTILWNDPALGIKWPVPHGASLLMSSKDERGQLLAEAERYP